MPSDVVISLLVVTGILIVLGILIKYFGMAHLIAGYNSKKITDKKGLTNFIGVNTLFVAVLSGITAIFEYTQPFKGYKIIWLVYIFGVFGLTARMIHGSRKYEK